MHIFGKHLECCSQQTDFILLACIHIATTLYVTTVHMRSSELFVCELEIPTPHSYDTLLTHDRLISPTFRKYCRSENFGKHFRNSANSSIQRRSFANKFQNSAQAPTVCSAQERGATAYGSRFIRHRIIYGGPRRESRPP